MFILAQNETDHLTLIEKVFSGGYNLSEIDIEKGGDGMPKIPKDEIMNEIVEVFSKGESFCRNPGEIAALIAVSDFEYLNQKKYFQRALSKINFYENIQEKLTIMTSGSAPYIPYFFDSGIKDFSTIKDSSYIAVIRQGSHRTDAVLFRYIEERFKVVNIMNRFKERGFSEEESVEFVDSLRTVQNNVLAECFLYILELKKGSSFPTFTKVLEGKKTVFLTYEQARSEIIENYYERMGIDLDIYAEKDAEQQRLSGRYAVTMQGMKQISNQQRFIDKSRFPLKRAPPPPGKIVNMDPYAETSMSPLQYIRFLRTAMTLPPGKQSKRVRDQGPIEPGSPDEAPPMDIVEAMCADQVDQEIEDSENYMNFDDEWLEKFGEKSMTVGFKSRFEGNPLLKLLDEPKMDRTTQEEKTASNEVRRDWKFGDEDEGIGVETDPPEEDEVPEGISRKMPETRKIKIKVEEKVKSTNEKIKKVEEDDPMIIEEPQPGPSRIIKREPDLQPSRVHTPQEVRGLQTIKTRKRKIIPPVVKVVPTKIEPASEVKDPEVGESTSESKDPSSEEKEGTTETKESTGDKGSESKPTLRRSTRTAAKNATAKIAIAHLPVKLPPSSQKSQNPHGKRKSSFLVSEDPILRAIFPLISRLEQKDWPFKKELTHSDVGYDRRYPKPIKDKNYFISKVFYRLIKKYGDISEIEKILSEDPESERNQNDEVTDNTEDTAGPSGIQNSESSEEKRDGDSKAVDDQNSEDGDSDSCYCISDDENEPQLTDLDDVILKEIMLLNQKDNPEDTESDSESDSGDESEDGIDIHKGSGFNFLSQVKNLRKHCNEEASEIDFEMYRFRKIKFSNKFLTLDRLIQRINERMDRIEKGSWSPSPEHSSHGPRDDEDIEVEQELSFKVEEKVKPRLRVEEKPKVRAEEDLEDSEDDIQILN